jgi:hypothetical protein
MNNIFLSVYSAWFNKCLVHKPMAVTGKSSSGIYLGSCIQQEKNSGKMQKYNENDSKDIRKCI